MQQQAITSAGNNSFLSLRTTPVLLFLSCLFIGRINAQNGVKFWQQANEMLLMLDKYHYSPPVIDEKVSEDVYNLTINTLDPYGLYFSKQDLDQFEKYRSIFIGELKKDETLISEITKKYKEVLLRTDSIINELGKKPFYIMKPDTIFFF